MILEFLEKSQDKLVNFDYFYALLMMTWSNLLVIFWQRHESELCVEWGTYGNNIVRADK